MKIHDLVLMLFRRCNGLFKGIQEHVVWLVLFSAHNIER